jgi:methionine-gamma-lyase
LAAAGYGGVLCFAVEGDRDTQNRFVANLKVVTSAVSLGHDETLIMHVSNEGPRVVYYPQPFKDYGHLRLSVGLEDAEDLIADLGAALESV